MQQNRTMTAVALFLVNCAAAPAFAEENCVDKVTAPLGFELTLSNGWVAAVTWQGEGVTRRKTVGPDKKQFTIFSTYPGGFAREMRRLDEKSPVSASSEDGDTGWIITTWHYPSGAPLSHLPNLGGGPNEYSSKITTQRGDMWIGKTITEDIFRNSITQIPGENYSVGACKYSTVGIKVVSTNLKTAEVSTSTNYFSPDLRVILKSISEIKGRTITNETVVIKLR
jgi:hypothetical protein